MLIPQFAEKLERILKQRGLTQTAFADMVGFSPRHLSKVKTGGDEVSEITIKKICAALEMSIDEFLEKETSEDNEYFPVPFREASGSMGGGGYNNSKKIISYISLRRDFLRTKTNSLASLSFINAFGESMSPTIPPDAIVLIDESQKEPVNGKIFYIMLNDIYLIKRLEVKQGKTIALISDNGNIREPIGPQDTLEILGRALLQQTML